RIFSTTTDRNLLFARPLVLGAARVRENWFLAHQAWGELIKGRARTATGVFCPVSGALPGFGG
ncbi:MAG TPA: hypothetical protein VN648_20005, partial [Candidatus Methylomirabilis sp.]|nr:hypothetical protein [Candidatus Methylomirabilis sp.]